MSFKGGTYLKKKIKKELVEYSIHRYTNDNDRLIFERSGRVRLRWDFGHGVL